MEVPRNIFGCLICNFLGEQVQVDFLSDFYKDNDRIPAGIKNNIAWILNMSETLEWRNPRTSEYISTELRRKTCDEATIGDLLI